MTVQTLKFYDLPTRDIDMTSEVLSGLSQANKQIAPKYFYDEIGSQLFTEITRQPEYYPTRTEIGLLRSLNEDLVILLSNPASVLIYTIKSSVSSISTTLLVPGGLTSLKGNAPIDENPNMTTS